MPRFRKQILQSFLLTGFLSIVFPLSGSAEPRKYFCAKEYYNAPATMQQNVYGSAPLIHWITGQYVNNLSPEKRCKKASDVLQTAYDNNTLKYLRAAFVKKQPVLCVVKTIEECANEAVAIDLNPDDDPNEVLAELLNIRDLVSNYPLYQNSEEVLFAESGFYYVDLSAIETLLACTEYPDQPCLLNK
jgi:hypothetical protein